MPRAKKTAPTSDPAGDDEDKTTKKTKIEKAPAKKRKTPAKEAKESEKKDDEKKAEETKKEEKEEAAAPAKKTKSAGGTKGKKKSEAGEEEAGEGSGGGKATEALALPLPPIVVEEKQFAKIISWNVNGIRAVLRSNGFNRLREYVDAEQPDVICIQETKVDEDAKPLGTLPGYEEYFNCCTSTKGYAGTCIFTRVKPLKVSYGLGIAEHDDEGRLICAEFSKFYLINTYVPNAGAKLERLDYRTKSWDTAMLAFLKKLEANKPIIWCGDLNVAHLDIDIHNTTPSVCKKQAGCTPQERESFTKMLKDGNFVDVFRKQNPNKKQYTFFAYRSNGREKGIGLRLDYFIVSQSIESQMKSVFVRDTVYGSDHLPMGLLLPKDML